VPRQRSQPTAFGYGSDSVGLTSYDYPSDKRERVVDVALEQAELFTSDETA